LIAIIAITLLPVFWALSDGFYDEQKKLISSVFKLLSLACVCAFPYAPASIWAAVYFLLCWTIVFDITYNIVRKLDVFYVGKTKLTDKLLRWFCDTNGFTRGHYAHVSFFVKLFAAALIFAVFFTGKL